MKTILILGIALLSTQYSNGQSESEKWLEKFSQCHNGVQDNGEDGVDCFKKSSLQGCNKCNGIFTFTLNRKPYISSVVQTSNMGLGGKSTMLMLMPRIYTDGTETSGLMLSLNLRMKSFETGTYKLLKSEPTGLSRFWGFTVDVNFKMIGIAKGISKVKEGSITVTKLDKMERTISGTFKAIGTLDDGTPLELEGAFTDVAFD